MPSLRKRIGCFRGSSIISRTFWSWSPSPPMSSYDIDCMMLSSSSSTGSSLITISVEGRTCTIPFGLVLTIWKGRASANKVIPGMKILSPDTTGLLFSPLLAKPSIPGPNLTFCCFAITGERTSFSHSVTSTFRMLTLSPRDTDAFFRIIPSIRITPKLASSGLHRHTIAAVDFSPLISMTSPGLRLRSLSNGTLALPCPTSLGMALATLSVSSPSPSDMLVPRYDPWTPPPLNPHTLSSILAQDLL